MTVSPAPAPRPPGPLADDPPVAGLATTAAPDAVTGCGRSAPPPGVGGLAPVEMQPPGEVLPADPVVAVGDGGGGGVPPVVAGPPVGVPSLPVEERGVLGVASHGRSSMSVVRSM